MPFLELRKLAALPKKLAFQASFHSIHLEAGTGPVPKIHIRSELEYWPFLKLVFTYKS